MDNQNKHKGVSLVELAVAVSLVALISILAFQILSRTFSFQLRAGDEEVLQRSMRRTSEMIKNVIRDSSGIFIMPAESFNRSAIDSGVYLTEGWDYIGILDKEIDGQASSELILFTYNPATGAHDEEILIEAKKGFIYELMYYKGIMETGSASTLDMSDKTIGFSLKSFEVQPDGSLIENMDLSSELEAINSLQVIDWGSASAANPGKALAFKGIERETTTSGVPAGVVRIAFVLDESASMGSQLGNSTRIEELKNAVLNIMLPKLKESGNVEIVVIPYSDNANYGYSQFVGNVLFAETYFSPGTHQLYDTVSGADYSTFEYKMVNVKEKYGELQFFVSNLEKKGVTNTGDGLRQGYWTLQKAAEADPPGFVVYEHVFLFTDGAYNLATMEYGVDRSINGQYMSIEKADPSFMMGPGNLPEKNMSDPFSPMYHGYRYSNEWRVIQESEMYKYIYINSALLDYGRDTAVTKNILALGEMIRSNMTENDKTHIVELGDMDSEARGMLEEALGTEVIQVIDTEGLMLAFEEVTEEIIKDTWFIDGPKY